MLLTLLSLIAHSGMSQILNADSPVSEEFLRRSQLLGGDRVNLIPLFLVTMLRVFLI